MLGYRTAQRAVPLGRRAFFGSEDADLPLRRSPELLADDLTPQFGFVGSQYSGARVLLIGINPGNGNRNDVRTRADAEMMPALARFAENPTEENFVKASTAYMNQCQRWPMWSRHCAEVIGAGKLSFEEIAYTNCLPWRTESKSNFIEAVAGKAAKLYACPLIEELNPRVIVAMGKRAAEILVMSGSALPNLIIWNRAQAATTSVKRERAETAVRILNVVGV